MGEYEELPERARRWVLSQIDDGIALTGIRRLTGGLSAETHALDVERPGKPSVALVLKRYTDLKRASCVGVEAASLHALASVPLPFGVARVVAADEAGTACDVTALLASRLPGSISLELQDWARRVAAVGDALAVFHAAHVPCPPGLADYGLVGSSQRREPIPQGVELPDWSRVWRFLEGGEWGGRDLLHGDYHLGNTIFAEGQLSGVVDWASARRGAQELDVAYCRLDLSMLLGESAPDVFLAAYERRLGRRIPNVSAWDLAASVRAFPDPLKWLRDGWMQGAWTLRPS